VHRENLRDPALHGPAGGRDGGGDHVVLEGHVENACLGQAIESLAAVRPSSGCGGGAPFLLFYSGWIEGAWGSTENQGFFQFDGNLASEGETYLARTPNSY
jgi:hypothetical protein